MRALLCLVILFISLAGFAQRSPVAPNLRKFKNDTIIWKKDSLLRQTDFKARPRANGPLGWSNLGILLYPDENGGELLFVVQALFVKSKSYLVKYTDYVLRHEQTHFDIAELYARQLRKKISEIDFKKIKNIQNELNKMYDKVLKDYIKEQEKYDSDTEHGLNPAKQKLWNDDISRRLTESDNFSAFAVPATH